jgi:pyruvate ferredoxin oxidoreductase gamma subunit/2-oxoisovalerate ferredoxin oxidoreductase gamma subunit
MIGAFARVFGGPPLEAVIEAIDEEIPARREANKQAARRAHEEVRFLKAASTTATSADREQA